MKQFELTRGVNLDECPWLDREFKKGDKVYEYPGYTYGCISFGGMACTEEWDKTPFFELPDNALKPL